MPVCPTHSELELLTHACIHPAAATFANNSLDEEPRSRVPPSHTTATTLAVHSSSPVYTHSSSPQVTIAQNATTTSAALGSRYITNRSSFLSTTDNNVSTAPSTPEQKVYRCEDEPIHIPGAIQSFGALIAVNENEDGLFVVRIVSENSKAVTGLDPESLFSLRCLTDLFPQSDKLDFISRAKALRTYKTRTSPDVFTLSLYVTFSGVYSLPAATQNYFALTNGSSVGYVSHPYREIIPTQILPRRAILTPGP